MSKPSSLPDLSHLAAAPTVRVLMVCMGNICRSPTAHGVLTQRVADAGLGDRIVVDSAGTHDYHVGRPPDERAQQHAARRGYDLSAQRARQLKAQDFDDFDLVLVMDDANEQAARALCPPAQRHRLRRLTDFCTRHRASSVPSTRRWPSASSCAIASRARSASTR